MLDGSEVRSIAPIVFLSSPVSAIILIASAKRARANQGLIRFGV